LSINSKNKEWDMDHDYTPEENKQIALNLVSKIMIAGITSDKNYLGIVAPGSRSSGLLKECIAISIKPETKNTEGTTQMFFDVSDSVTRLVQSEKEYLNEVRRTAAS